MQALLLALLDPMRLAKLFMGNITDACKFLVSTLTTILAGFVSGHAFSKAAADSMAADTTAETPFAITDRAGTLFEIDLAPLGALTASNTTYASIVIGWRSAGGALQVVRTITTKLTGGGGTGDWATVAGTVAPFAITTSLTNTIVPSGAVLSYSIAKASTGVAVPAFLARVKLKGS